MAQYDTTREDENRVILAAIEAGHRTATSMRKATGFDELRRRSVITLLYQRGEVEFDPKHRQWHCVPERKLL